MLPHKFQRNVKLGPSDPGGLMNGRKLLEDNMLQLINTIRPSHFRILVYRKILSHDDWEEITNKWITTTDRNYELLGIIMRKGDKSIQVFFEVLGLEYPDLYKSITGRKAPRQSNAYKTELRDSLQQPFEDSYRYSGEILAGMSKLINLFAKDVDSKKRDITNLTQKHEKEKCHIDVLVSELAECREEQVLLRDERGKLAEQCEKFTNDFDRVSKERDELEEQLIQKENKLEQLQRELDTLKSEHRTATEKCKFERQKSMTAPTNRQLQLLQEENLKLTIQLDKCKVMKKDEHVEVVIQLRKELAAARKKSEQSESLNTNQEIKLESVEKQLEDVQQQVIDLKKTQQALRTDKTTLAERVKKLEENLHAERSITMKLDMKCRQLGQDLDDKEKVIHNFREFVRTQISCPGALAERMLPRLPTQPEARPLSDTSSSDSDNDYEQLDESHLSHIITTAGCSDPEDDRAREDVLMRPNDRNSGSSDDFTSRMRPSPLVENLHLSGRLFPECFHQDDKKSSVESPSLVYIVAPVTYHDAIHAALCQQSDFSSVTLDKGDHEHEYDILQKITETNGEAFCLFASTLKLQILEHPTNAGYLVLSSKLPVKCLDSLTSQNYNPLLLIIEDDCNSDSDANADLKQEFAKKNFTIRTIQRHLATDRLAHLVHDIRMELRDMRDSNDDLHKPS